MEKLGLPGANRYPWLVFFQGERYENQVLCDAVSETKTSFTRSIPELINSPVLKSTNIHGWLLLQDGPVEDLFPWDPVSMLLCTFSSLNYSDSLSGYSWRSGRPDTKPISGAETETGTTETVIGTCSATGTGTISETVTGTVQLCLWSAVSLESIKLPSLELESVRSIQRALLTKDPTDPDCVVLLWINDLIVYCHVNGGNDRTWIHRDYFEELAQLTGLRDLKYGHNDAFACDDGRIFMSNFSEDFLLSEVHTVKPKRVVIRPLKCKKPRNHAFGTPAVLWMSHWVSCCGDIYVIHVTFGESDDLLDIVGVLVLKLDFSNMSWETVVSCPNAAFFISCDDAMSCPIASADSSSAGNRVYFAGYFDNENRPLLYTYHIQQMTLSVSLLVTPENASKPYWILVPDAQALTKAEEDYLKGESGEGGEDHLLVNQSIRGGARKYIWRGLVEKIKKLANFSPYWRLITTNSKSLPLSMNSDETMLNDLSVDILRLITSRLINPIDYLNFRASSKLCCSIGSAKECKTISGGIDQISSPWLMIPSLVNKGVSSMVDPVSSNRFYLRTSWDSEYACRIAYSSNGWLLMHSTDHISSEEGGMFNFKVMLSLYNPLTKCKVSLPDLPGPMSQFFFTGSPSSSSPYCLVFAFDLSSKFLFFIELIGGVVQKEWWSEGHITLPGEERFLFQRQSNVNPVFMNGRFYNLTRGNLAVVDWENKEEVVEEIEGQEHLFSRYQLSVHNLKEPCNSSSYVHKFLVECGGDLLSIYIGEQWEWLRVFRFNESEMAWEQVDDLDNNNIYLSAVSCVAKKAKCPEMGSRIYLPSFHEEQMVHYSLDTCEFHSGSGGGGSLAIYTESKEQLYSCWLEPSWN